MDTNSQIFMHVVDTEIMGYYVEGIHDVIPEGSIPISQELWKANLEMGATHFKDGWSTAGDRISDIQIKTQLDIQWRNTQLLDSDKYMLSDYPITDDQRAEVIAYRQALRDYTVTQVRPVKPEWMA